MEEIEFKISKFISYLTSMRFAKIRLNIKNDHFVFAKKHKLIYLLITIRFLLLLLKFVSTKRIVCFKSLFIFCFLNLEFDSLF